MWCFKGREDLCIYILPNQKKSFGTIQSDIKLEGDVTVSKLHSIVSIEITEKSKIEYKCVISDVSKYGTFVTRNKEKKKLPPNDEFILKNGDIVQFGLKESIFVVLCYSFVIAKSNLDEEEMKKLKHIADYLKIKLSETWENFCTHLTVAESTLFTTKLACALASAKPIVTIAYWEAVNTAVKESKELPKIEDFLPRVKEEWLKVYSRLFLPNEKRRKLLKGLLFVHFCAKQYFVYAPLIIAAGGKSCVYPTKRPLTPQDLIAKNAIVIQQPINDSLQLTQDVTTDYSIICDKLKAVKRRMISDTEIPLAVLYCTMEIYCNPKFDFISFLKLKVQTFSPSDIIISENTQDVNINKKQIKKQIIPDTCEIQNENFSKKIHSFVENYKRYIFDVNKNNVTQNIDNEEIRHKIISYDFEIERNILKSAYIFNEDEQKYMFNSSKNNIEMKNMQNNREIKYKISTIVCNSKNNENIFKKAHFFNENEQRYVFNSSRSNTAKNPNNDIFKNIYFSSKSEERNISDNNANKQFQIIPNCYILEKDINNTFSSKNNKQDQIISETSEFIKDYIINTAIEKKQQIVELENKLIFENMLINEENNLIFEKTTIEPKNIIIEKDNNDKFANARQENSKYIISQISIPRIEINDSEIYVKQEKEINILEKNCSSLKLQNLLKKQKLNPIYNSKKNWEDKRTNENKIQKMDNRKRKLKKTGDNWCERYLDQTFTNEILRKDITCGKKFKKIPVIKPERVLRVDDFAL